MLNIEKRQRGVRQNWKGGKRRKWRPDRKSVFGESDQAHVRQMWPAWPHGDLWTVRREGREGERSVKDGKMV